MDLTTTLLLAVSGIIFLGFIADMIFKKLGLPHVIILLAIGFAIGPSAFGYVDFSHYDDLKLFLGTLTIVFVLFQSGLELDIFEVIHKSGRALLMSFVSALLSAAACAVALNYLFGFDLWVGAIFGAIAANTASQIVMPIAKGFNLSGRLRHFFVIESSSNDGVCIVLAIILITSFLSHSFDLQNAGKILMSSFSIGIVLGVLVGTLTVIFLSKAKNGLDYPYMLSMAILLVLYLASDYLGGSGVISALAYGIMLGNRKNIGDMLRLGKIEDDVATARFQTEISFFITTFFFIYMGTIITITSVKVLMIAAAAAAALFVARVVAAYVTTWKSDLSRHAAVITVMQARGIDFAVMSFLPFILITKLGPSGSMASALDQFSLFPDLAIGVVLITILINAVGMMLLKGKIDADREAEEEEAAVRDAAKGAVGAKARQPQQPKGPERTN
jgi:cell volume regulation protein A